MSQDDMSPEEAAKAQAEQCVFCKIISGQIPSSKIYEDDEVLSILDINPASDGHVLLLPKKHYQIMPQIPEKELANLFVKSKKLSNALLQAFQTKGTSIFVANGGVAGQRAPHFMIHIVPRKKDDGLFSIPKKEADNAKLAQIQQALIANLSKAFGRPVVQKPIKKEMPKPQEVKEDQKPIVEEEKTENASSNRKNNDTDLDRISEMFLK